LTVQRITELFKPFLKHEYSGYPTLFLFFSPALPNAQQLESALLFPEI